MREETVAMDEVTEDFFPVKDVDYLEMYSGNAKQSAIISVQRSDLNLLPTPVLKPAIERLSPTSCSSKRSVSLLQVL